MKYLYLFPFLFAIAAQPSINSIESFKDGNEIEDPVLLDYVVGDRQPGILVEPYDVVQIPNPDSSETNPQ